jgi:hypothetical protein
VFAAAIGGWHEWGLPGAPFILAAIMLAGAMGVAWRVTRPGEVTAEVMVAEAAL